MQKSSSGQNFAQGAVVLMAGTLTVKAVSMLFKIPISNLLGATGYACFTGAYELFNLFATVAAAGFPVAISKLVAENRAQGRYRDNRRIFAVSWGFFLVAGLLCMTAMMAGAKKFAAMIPNPGAALSIFCLAPSVLTCCLMAAYRGYYQGMQNMYPTCISQIIEAVSKLILGLGLCMLTLWAANREYHSFGKVLGHTFERKEQASMYIAELSSGAAVLGVTLSTLTGFFYLVHLWHKQKDGISDRQLLYAPKPKSAGTLFCEILKIGIPVCLGSIAINISGIIDLMTITGGLEKLMTVSPEKLMAVYQGKIPRQEILNHSVHNYLYGVYSGKAVVAANLIPALTYGIAVSALPAVAESFASLGKNHTAHSIETVLRLTAAVCIPAGMGMSALAKECCAFFFGGGPETEIAAPLLKILGIASIFIALSASLTSILQAVGETMLPVKLLILGSAVKWAMNRYLVRIPAINVKAAACSTLVCYIIIVSVSLLVLQRKTGPVHWFSAFHKPAAAGTMCAFCAVQVQRMLPWGGRFRLLISAGVGGMVYLLGLLALKGIRKEEVLLLPKGEKMAKILEKCDLLG